jgi:hypothetical protein
MGGGSESAGSRRGVCQKEGRRDLKVRPCAPRLRACVRDELDIHCGVHVGGLHARQSVEIAAAAAGEGAQA